MGQGVPGRGRVSAMGLCRGAHMVKIFTRVSWLQAQERPEPDATKLERAGGLMLTF